MRGQRSSATRTRVDAACGGARARRSGEDEGAVDEVRPATASKASPHADCQTNTREASYLPPGLCTRAAPSDDLSRCPVFWLFLQRSRNYRAPVCKHPPLASPPALVLADPLRRPRVRVKIQKFKRVTDNTVASPHYDMLFSSSLFCKPSLSCCPRLRRVVCVPVFIGPSPRRGPKQPEVERTHWGSLWPLLARTPQVQVYCAKPLPGLILSLNLPMLPACITHMHQELVCRDSCTCRAHRTIRAALRGAHQPRSRVASPPALPPCAAVAHLRDVIAFL